MKKTFLLFVLLLFILPAQNGYCEKSSVAGTWHCKLDQQDVGEKERWFKQKLDKSQPVKLPGSLSENGMGYPIIKIIQDAWGSGPTPPSEPVWNPMLKLDYRGAVWYQKTVVIPSGSSDRFLELSLERVCWQSTLWVDDRQIGEADSLTTPHHYDLGILAPGPHRLTLRIDNRKIYELGKNTHSYHEGSCTIFNGAIGELALTAHPAVFIRNTQVAAESATGWCDVRVTLSNQTAQEIPCKLKATIRRQGSSTVLGRGSLEVKAPVGETLFHFRVPVPKEAVSLWSEFAQPLYLAQIEAACESGREDSTVRFGFRSYETRGAQFFMNGKPLLWRADVNDAQFPLTGYPPMNKAEWLKIFRLYKDFGFNGVRFHAWTPPEAAFEVADEIGLYLQPELPNSVKSITLDTERGLPWRQAEFDHILETYGNHPSFMQMTMGNEVKSLDLSFLKGLVVRGREQDPRHLYATMSNPEASAIKDEVPGDDFAVAHGGSKGRRRMESFFNSTQPSTKGDYRETMVGRPVPQISHEVGQWFVYPDLSETERYTGVLRSVALEYFHQLAQQKGVDSQCRDFVNASGKLSCLLYKEEVERALRTPQNGGFQLLSLEDNFDQGSAYVGQVNLFYEPKPYVTGSSFREFCASQVLLARLEKRVWLNNETLTADLELANYGPSPLRKKNIEWKLRDAKGGVRQGVLGPLDLPDTGLQSVGHLEIPLSWVKEASKLELSVFVKGTKIVNRWNVWVYPPTLSTEPPPGVKVVRTLDEQSMKELQAGGCVVLFPAAFSSRYPTAMTTPFWSPIMFSQNMIAGFCCDPKHPALREFPTDNHSDWQWYELMLQGSAIALNGTPENYRPIVQGIDKPSRNDKLGLIYESKVGSGRLLVCTLDLQSNLDQRPVARQLRRSLLDYAASHDFNPQVEITLKNNLPETSHPSVLGLQTPKVDTDSQAEGFPPGAAVDNDPATFWQTLTDVTATPPPHELTFFTLRGEAPRPPFSCRVVLGRGAWESEPEFRNA